MEAEADGGGSGFEHGEGAWQSSAFVDQHPLGLPIVPKQSDSVSWPLPNQYQCMTHLVEPTYMMTSYGIHGREIFPRRAACRSSETYVPQVG
jgi:hypothetical protein